MSATATLAPTAIAPAVAPAPSTTGVLAPAPVLGFLLVHSALRRDAAGLVAAAERGDDLRTPLELFDRVLRTHHHGEDEVLMPVLASRDPGVHEVVAQLADQHVELDRTLDFLTTWVHEYGGCGPDLVAEVRRLEALLEEHLTLEETRLLPVWSARLDDEDQRELGRRLRRATPWRDVSVMVPWLMHSMPVEARPFAERELPVHVRMAYRFVLSGWYQHRWRA